MNIKHSETDARSVWVEVLPHPECKPVTQRAIEINGRLYWRSLSGKVWRLSEPTADGWRVPGFQIKNSTHPARVALR